MANEKKNTYDITRDLCIAPALVFHLDTTTGAEVGGPGEGVESFGIVLRSMVNEGGERGPARVAIHGAFIAKAAKGSTARWARWMVGAGGKCVLGEPVEGALCLGGGSGRLDAALAAAVYAKAAAYATRCAAKLAEVKSKAA
jgi:hypothetical protein